MCRWKRPKRGNDRRKNITGKRPTCEQRDTVLRGPTVCMSIQQKTDSLCGGNHGSLTCALNKFGDGRNGDEFAAGNFISPLTAAGLSILIDRLRSISGRYS